MSAPTQTRYLDRARFAGLCVISGFIPADPPQLIIFTSSEAMTREAVEALRRAYPTQLIQESTKPGGPSVLHAIQDISQLNALKAQL